MRLDLTTLRLFLAVVEERSISRAAKREHITGPAISKRVTEIEQWLGVRLLERHSGGIRPTAAGNMLAAEAANISGILDRLRARLSDYAEGQRGEVRVSSNASGLAGGLPEDLKRFAMSYPLVTLQIKERRSTEVVEAVKDGKADLGVFSSHAAISTKGLEVHPYEEGRLVLITALGHPLSNRRMVRLTAAAQYEFVGISPDTTVGYLLRRVAAEHGITLKSRIEVKGHEPMRRLVQAGMGLGVLPEWAVPYAKAVKLCCVPLIDRQARYIVNICTPPYENLSMSTRKLLAHLRNRNQQP